MPKTKKTARKASERRARPSAGRRRVRKADLPHTEVLAKSLLFRSAPRELIQEILAGNLTRELDVGESLLTPALPNSTLYVLLSGQMHVLLGESRDAYLPILPGECVGELSVIDGSRVSAPVVATEPSLALAIDVERFWWLTERYPTIARNLLSIMVQRVRITNTALMIRIRAHEREELLARVDNLTSVYNRRWLDENLPRYLERAQSTGSVLVVGLFDIDHFKKYNDTWGHMAGDVALRAVSRAVRDHIRPPDQLSRYGGEEFCLLLPDTLLEHVPKLAARLVEIIGGATIRSNTGESWPSVTASIGFTASRPDDTAEKLLQRADQALYRAKNAGRNRFVLDGIDPDDVPAQ